MDYIKLLLDICGPLVHKPEELQVSIEKEEDKFIQLLVLASEEDTGRLIGKGGATAETIRELVNVSAKLSNKRVHVKFDSRK